MNEHSFEEAFDSKTGVKIEKPEDGAQGLAPIGSNSKVAVIFVAGAGWFTHYDAKEVRAAMRAEERRVRKDSLPAG